MPATQRILITGGAGFIGSHLAVFLFRKYPEVSITVLDALLPCSSMASLAGILDSHRFHFILGDITCSVDVEKALAGV